MLQPALHVNPAALPTVQPPSTADVKAVLQRVRAALPALALQVVPFARSLRVETLSGAAVGLTVHWFKGAWVATVWTPSGKFELSAADAHTLLAVLPTLVMQAQADAYDTDLLHAPGLTVRCFHDFTWHDVPAPTETTMAKTFKLNDDQQKVADDLAAFISRPGGEAFLLKGYAGTGKTSTLLHVLAGRTDVWYITPSHAAKNVIRKAALDAGGCVRVSTLASALGSKRVVLPRRFYNGKTYDREIDEFFETGDADGFAKRLDGVSIVVLDEASMVTGGLFERLCNLLGLGTEAGARIVRERETTVRADDIEARNRIAEMLYSAYDPRDPLDVGAARKVVGRPRQRAEAGGMWRYMWDVEVGRKPMKLIVMGDPAQLEPVHGKPLPVGHPRWTRDDTWRYLAEHNLLTQPFMSNHPSDRAARYHISPALTSGIYVHVAELTKLERTGSIELLLANTAAREHALTKGEGMYIIPASTQTATIRRISKDCVVDAAVAAYRARENVVVVGMRNSTLNALATEIRSRLLGPGKDTNTLHVGEPAIFSKPCEAVGEGGATIKYNNGDMVFVIDTMPVTAMFPALGLQLRASRLTLGSAGSHAPAGYKVTRLHDDEADVLKHAVRAELARLDEQQRALEGEMATASRRLAAGDTEAGRELVKLSMRQDDIDEQRSNVARQTQPYARLQSSYTRTCHKVQGGSFDHVIYLQWDLMETTPMMNKSKPHAAYVAISRARNTITVAH